LGGLLRHHAPAYQALRRPRSTPIGSIKSKVKKLKIADDSPTGDENGEILPLHFLTLIQTQPRLAWLESISAPPACS
jgi:hypothetical protein